ncbi:MAG TPA: hypothetical protein VFQ27_07380 [Xanthobacteraceae bacterium]|nr:hypothetical protein [Xanthobacteraceae bacterium]
MWKAALAGLIALAAAGMVPASAEDFGAPAAATAQADPAVEAKIARAKAALRLRPDQERHWPAVAAAIREWAYRPVAAEESFVRSARRRAADWAGRANRARKVLIAAMPLMRTLDAEQKRTAAMLARALGFESIAAAAL